jgi:hypothetical protein
MANDMCSGQEACIDYVLDMLADGVTSPLGPVLSKAHPRIYEMLWELLHALCVSPLTTDSTMYRLEVCPSLLASPPLP